MLSHPTLRIVSTPWNSITNDSRTFTGRSNASRGNRDSECGAVVLNGASHMTIMAACILQWANGKPTTPIQITDGPAIYLTTITYFMSTTVITHTPCTIERRQN